MTRRRVESELDVNFDGLTDVVTNLAGALVLLVVLLIGVTSYVPPVAPLGSGEGQDANLLRVEPLLERVSELRVGLQLAEDGLESVQQELPPLQEKVDRLYAGK